MIRDCNQHYPIYLSHFDNIQLVTCITLLTTINRWQVQLVQQMPIVQSLAIGIIGLLAEVGKRVRGKGKRNKKNLSPLTFPLFPPLAKVTFARGLLIWVAGKEHLIWRLVFSWLCHYVHIIKSAEKKSKRLVLV
ncbi:hypothetical protein [Nostoc sp.]|uniref:hypothetical protein n=1 Tax=Nostoc sp. TaxID=1180 RepID=UPI002FF457BD